MVKSELEDIKKPINRKIIEIVIIDQMNTMASMFFGLIKRVHCVECVYNKRVRKNR